jgi:hypothetical protein
MTLTGLDFWFLIIDYAGAFFSLMAVGECPYHRETSRHFELTQKTVAQQWFDALGASLYIAWYVVTSGIKRLTSSTLTDYPQHGSRNRHFRFPGYLAMARSTYTQSSQKSRHDI